MNTKTNSTEELMVNLNEITPLERPEPLATVEEATPKVSAQIVKDVAQWKVKGSSPAAPLVTIMKAAKDHDKPLAEAIRLAVELTKADPESAYRNIGMFFRTICSQLLKYRLRVDSRIDWIQSKKENDPSWELPQEMENPILDVCPELASDTITNIKSLLDPIYIAYFPTEDCLPWKQYKDEEGSWVDVEDMNQALFIEQREYEEYKARQAAERVAKLEATVDAIANQL